jgi:SAM-dependent methyltransferase
MPAESALRCAAGHEYPIRRGVSRFVPEAPYTESFGRQWNRWATTQLDSANGTSVFRERFARYFGDPGQLSGLDVVDAGCGVGAFVDIVAPYARSVIGFDLSSAVEAARANVGDLENVSIAQADIFRPPLAAASFDFVYCIGVIQHTPDPARAFAGLARLVRPGGRLAVWIYERSAIEPLKPRHLVRRFTSELEAERAMRFVEAYAPRALRARRALARIGDGRLRKLVPVADPDDYAGAITRQLDERQVAEWCVMDTHDMLITTYDSPQRPETVRAWYEEHGFGSIRRSDAEGIAMIGTRG